MDRNIACRRTAQKCVREGDLEQAVGAYEEVVSSGDADPYDYVYAGDLYVKLDLIEEAVARFHRGVSAYSRLGFNRNAIALCRRILRLDAKQLEVQRELGDLFATEGLLDDALEAYLHYLEGVPREAHEDEAFRETLVRIEELAPRRPAYALRLSEFLESLGHTDASADVLSRAADLARSSGAEDVASELMERALGLNPALAKAADVANSIEERLQHVHRSKVQPGSGEPPAPSAARPAAAEAAAACEQKTTTAAAAPASAPGEPYEISVDECETDDGEGGDLLLPGFQEVDFDEGTGAGTSESPAIDPLRTVEDRRSRAGGRGPSLPSVGRVEIQSSTHPAAAATQSTPSRPAPAGGQTEAQSDGPLETADAAEALLRDEGAAEEATTSDAPAGTSEEYEEEDPAQAARAAIASGDWKLARRWVEAWLLKDPTSHEAADAMIEACEAQQDRAGVIEGLTLKGDLLIQGQELPAAVPLFWRVLEMDPQNETARRRMGRFRELGLVAADAGPGLAGAEAAEAGAESAAVASSTPANSPAEAAPAPATLDAAPPRRPEEEPIIPARALAVLAALRGDPKEPVDPQESETHYARGLVHMEMGRFAEALEEFEAALTEADLNARGSVKIWELRGKCLSGLGRHRDAIAELEPVLAGLESSDRGAATLQYFLALEYETLGEFDAAKECLRKVLVSAPGFEQASRRLSQLEERAA